MIIDYLFSSPGGDIPLGSEDLVRPFLLTPSKPHPFLTLGDYFKAIERFVLKDEGKCLLKALRAVVIAEDGLDRIDRFRIRSEKHGALYHVASVEILGDGISIKMAVSTAISEEARACLSNEYHILESLYQLTGLSCLPKVYEKGDVTCPDAHQPHESLALMLSEWFEGYHEWHLSKGEKDNYERVCIWDLHNGYRYATEEEAFEIFKQASRILTLCYDPRSFKRIHPWRHAAGDFIVKTGDEGIQVRLTTVRGYRSIMDIFNTAAVDPLIAMAYFFLDLTVWMRLDRLDGVGETVWAADFSVQATTEGFLESLPIMVEKDLIPSNEIRKLRPLLRSLDEDDLERLFQPLLTSYEEDAPNECRVIQTHLAGHIRSLRQALRKSP